MTSVDEIKARLDIVDLVSETVKLRRSGKSYTGFCPFHPNSKTPAFAVFPDSGTWRCFGQCNEGGDIFKYVMKREGWDFTEALRYLADKAGVTLTALTPEQKEKADEFESLRNILEESVKFYQYHLLKAPTGGSALDYLLKRGINLASIEKFELGYAPDSYEAAINHLNSKGHSMNQLQDVGLIIERDKGGFYDKFRNRIMFPIRDGAGKITGFGARILNPDDMPKFLNSPQTSLFNKGHLLYGLNLARKSVRESNQVVIVEGYLDVIALHQCGFENTVSPMGTALNEDQLRYLKKYTRRIVLALDADAAGEKATLRGLEMARHALDHETEMVFDAHGLLRHEARLQADVRVTTLPEGKDPDDVVLKDSQEWASILANAKPIVVHVMDALAAGQNLDDAKVRSSIATQVLPLIEDVPSAVERDTYRQQLARLLKVDERSLVGSQKIREGLRKRSRQESGRPQTESVKIAATIDQRSQQLELHCLTLFFYQPEGLYDLDRALKKVGLEKINPSEFESSENHTLLQLFYEGLNQDDLEPLEYIQTNISEELEERLSGVLANMPVNKKNDEKLFEDLFRTVINLRLIRVNATLNQLRYMQEDGITQEDLVSLQEMMLRYTAIRGKLDLALARTTLNH